MANKETGKKGKAEAGGRGLLIGSAKHGWPFSRGLLAQTLRFAGASRKEAENIARRVEQQLRDDHLSPIRPEDLHTLLVKVTREQAGRALAKQVEGQTPFFQDVQVRGQEGKRPFSRTQLARRLDDTGLDTKEAYEVARLVDLRLRALGIRELDAEELRDHVSAVLAQEYGEHFARTYQYVLSHQGRIGVVSSDDVEAVTPIPFSKGILMQSLLAAGASPDDARTLARAVQRDLQDGSSKLVTRAHIRQLVQDRLRHEAGKHVSARYGLLRAVRHQSQPLLILIGGVTGTGKSHLASEVAYRLGIPRIINTDSVREVMRAIVPPDLMPTLHTSTFDAWRMLLPPGEARATHPDPVSLELGFREQARQVSVGLNAIARRLIHENADVVAEGVHLVPGFLGEGLQQEATLVTVLLTVPDEKEHRLRFTRREQETSARPESRYLANFNEIRGLQEYLIRTAELYSMPVISQPSLDEQADRVVDIVLSRISARLRAQHEQDAEDHLPDYLYDAFDLFGADAEHEGESGDE